MGGGTLQHMWPFIAWANTAFRSSERYVLHTTAFFARCEKHFFLVVGLYLLV